MRQIVLDTETTGLEAALGHKIIEIGGKRWIHVSKKGPNIGHLSIGDEFSWGPCMR